MAFVKLFQSLLDSTVWTQEPHHVARTWITMLLMADRDGVVEASVPGLAHRALVTIEQAEEALEKFLAPDKYSRTPDYEGRRIERIHGGWRLLNLEVYRDKLDQDDQRAKAAERQQRKRDRETRHAPSRSVTPGHAESRRVRHAEVEAEADQEREIANTPEDPQPLLPEPPDTLPSAARSSGDPEEPERSRSPEEDQGDAAPGSHRRFLLPHQVPHRDKSAQRRKLFNDAWVLCAYEHLRARGDGVDPQARDCWAGEPGANKYERELLNERIDELTRGDSPNWGAAEAAIRNRVLVAFAEARRTGSLQFCTPARMWDAKSFAIGSAMTPEQAAARRGPRLVESAKPAPRYRRVGGADDDMPPLGPDPRASSEPKAG